MYPGEAKPLPSASSASSQGSAEPQAHGFGCLTPAWARQEGKGEIAGKFTVIHSPKTTLVFSGLFCSMMCIWVKVSKVPASVTGPTRLPPFKRTATSKESAHSKFLMKTKPSLNALAHRVQRILQCAQANLWAEVLRR